MTEEKKEPAKVKGDGKAKPKSKPRARARKRAPAQARVAKGLTGSPDVVKCVVTNDGSPSQINVPGIKPLFLQPGEQVTVDLDQPTIAKIQRWLGVTSVKVAGKAG